MNLSFQKLFYAISTAFALFAIMVFARAVLIPLSVALLLSFILLPLVKRFESWKMGKALAAFLSIFVVFIILGGVIYFFSTQIINISREFSNFKDKIIHAFADVTIYINRNVSFMDDLGKDELSNRMKSWLNDATGSLVSKTVSTTATFLAGLLATVVFTFLFIIYRDGLTKSFLAFAPEQNRKRVLKMFKSVYRLAKNICSE